MSNHSQATDQSTHHMKLFQKIIEDGFSRANFAVIDEIVAPHIAEHQAGMGQGPAGVKGAISYLRSVFPDFTLTVEDMTCDGDKVWARLRARRARWAAHGHAAYRATDRYHGI